MVSLYVYDDQGILFCVLFPESSNVIKSFKTQSHVLGWSSTGNTIPSRESNMNFGEITRFKINPSSRESVDL